ncbi:hypothetical protein PIB30_048279 [Stylosanthes scabra]|uniref:Uncharacterized protein n=1 Tax=Stylosanthes scabra TaxID=79078 RepID=A0ABU6TGT8_9FABA|nr:hypothetical protein [Stylosanthes scabra]
MSVLLPTVHDECHLGMSVVGFLIPVRALNGPLVPHCECLVASLQGNANIPELADVNVNIPESVDVNVVISSSSSSSSSSSNDGRYESVEDEPYKPPPLGYESDSSEEVDASVKAKKKKGKAVAARKKKYSGKRKKYHVLSGSCSGSGSGIGPSVGDGVRSGTGSNAGHGSGLGSGHVDGDGMGQNIDELNMDDLMGQHGGPNTEDEERGPDGPEFNERNGYEEIQLEFGMQFPTKEKFINALKDVFVSEGRDLRPKQRIFRPPALFSDVRFSTHPAHPPSTTTITHQLLSSNHLFFKCNHQ